MFDPTEREQHKLNEGRLMRAEADIIMPLLAEKREIAINKLILAFREGHADKLPTHAAELSSIEDMLTTIRNKIRQAEVLERKIHGNGK